MTISCVLLNWMVEKLIFNVSNASLHLAHTIEKYELFLFQELILINNTVAPSCICIEVTDLT